MSHQGWLPLALALAVTLVCSPWVPASPWAPVAAVEVAQWNFQMGLIPQHMLRTRALLLHAS